METHLCDDCVEGKSAVAAEELNKYPESADRE